MTERQMLGDGPVEERFRGYMKALSSVLNEDWPNACFVVIMTDFSNDGHARVSYISNADRRDVKLMMEEQIERFEEQDAQSPVHPENG